jgi:tetratricopeptide (TPR) repeat protein
MLADLYLQADSYLPALETIQRLLESPEARGLSASRRAAFEAKAIACRLAQGDAMAALAQCRDVLARESTIDSLPVRVPACISELRMRCSGSPVYDECQERAERALTLAEDAGDLGLQAGALAHLGHVAAAARRSGPRRVSYDRGSPCTAASGTKRRARTCATIWGLIHKNLCEWDTSAAHLRGALEIYRKLGRLGDIGITLLNLGVVHQKQGDWERALESYREAEHAFLQVGDPLASRRVRDRNGERGTPAAQPFRGREPPAGRPRTQPLVRRAARRGSGARIPG